jgi:hypothetical protein
MLKWGFHWPINKGVSNGTLMIFGLSMMVPVISLLYIKLEKMIMRRAGVPPLQEHLASLRFPDQAREIQEPLQLRKAA